MVHKYWPAGATLIADVFGFSLTCYFPEFDGFLDWKEWAHDEDVHYIERIPPNPIVKSWEIRAEYPNAKRLFQVGFPVAGALSELQCRLHDVVSEIRVYPQALDLQTNRALRLSTVLLRPSLRPVLGRGVWFDSISPQPENEPDITAEIGSVFFDAIDANRIKTAMNERWPASVPNDAFNHSLSRPRDRAKYALLTLFGGTDRQPGASQEAVHAQVNEFLSSENLPIVSETTVRRVLGERG
jgi:hypothetical protein